MLRSVLVAAGLSLSIAPSLMAAEPAAPAAPSGPVGAPAPGSGASAVDCGTVTCFWFRVGLGAKDADARSTEAMDTINKYLGGRVGKVTTLVAGKNIKLLLNGEQVALITPADAAAEKEKTVAAVAAKWRKKLEIAFEATKAQL
jgi:hypothetical protein